MRREDFHYQLPPELIAQTPLPHRDQSRLLVLDRKSGSLTHSHFRQLADFLHKGDLLVLNDSRVIRARLRAIKVRGGGKIEVLLLRPVRTNEWWVMLKPGKRAPVGTEFTFLDHAAKRTDVGAQVVEMDGQGQYRLKFSGCADVSEHLDSLGEVPLPPYIKRADKEQDQQDSIRYQTVFSRVPGSVAAPTAGLHFTKSLLDQLRATGIGTTVVTLHVGPATFAPVKTDRIEDHRMHLEEFTIDPETATAVNATKARGGRVIAVGTTSLRTLESAARREDQNLKPLRSSTDIFIHPPFKFRIADALLTNFHIPESTLLMLVSAFAAPGSTLGRRIVLKAYEEAVRERYRFFSYGDAMLIV